MRQALYRKYRPKTFEEVYGQDNIVNILRNQIKNNKISHAYIFSGTRGTGKTSTAKIFAKAVNCLDLESGIPCNKCRNCIAIQEESSMDIVEMDAASNRGIEDIRQLREQVIYPPTLLRYKVYIIDEAHMITNEGFNALLKIMEEPPKHLIFILATTEIEKIPNTILSRTQRFEFKSLSIEDIKTQIKNILNIEGVSMEERAVEVIGTVASGAMRDALSVLDQVISIGKDVINVDDVYDLLGVFSDDIKRSYCKSIFQKNISELYKLIDEELNKGKDPNHFIKEIILFFNDLIYMKIGVKENIVENLLDNISLEQLVNSTDILIEYEEIMRKSDSSSILFKIASTRLISFMPRKQIEAKIKNLEDRISYLEEHGAINQKNITTKELSKQSVNVDDIEKVFTEYDDLEKKNAEKSNLAEEKENKELKKEELIENRDSIKKTKNLENHTQVLLKILREKYPHTKLLLEGLKDIKQRSNKIILYISKDKINFHLGMNLYFVKAKEDLKRVVGKEYEIECKEFKESSLKKESSDNINKLKKIFPEDKLIIKDK